MLIKKQIYKGTDCLDIYSKIFKEGYNVNDIPFSIRKNDIEKLELNAFPFHIEIDEVSLINVDKLYFMFGALNKMNKEILKHLNLIVNATLKPCELNADFIIIRHNRIMLVEFCYDLTANNNLEIKEQQMSFVMNKLENTLKKYLPIDTLVQSYLFHIRKGDNQFEMERLAKTIDNFYLKSPNKELLKLLK